MPQRGTQPLLRYGFEAWLFGIRFLVGSSRARRLALVPALAFALLALTFSAFGIWLAASVTSRLDVASSGAWAVLGQWLLRIALSALAIACALIASALLAQPSSAPALDALSSMTSESLGAKPTDPASWLSACLRSVRVVLASLLVSVPIFTVLMAISVLIPGGAVVGVPLQFVLSGLVLAWDILDYPLSARGLGVRARVPYFRAHAPAIVSFGCILAAATMVPGLGLFALPVAVVGGTWMVAALPPKER